MSRWSWRIGRRELNEELGLRYEPGGWGDLLKGLWAAEVAVDLLASGASPLRFADVFAGAPDYPITDAAAARLAAISGTRFGDIVAATAAAGRLPSTAAAVRVAAAGAWEATLFETEGRRLAAWNDVPGVRLVDVRSGWRALDPAILGRPHLVLVDPYDVVGEAEARGALAGMAALLAGGSRLLLYVYNRSPRGPAPLDAYRAFRRDLDGELGRPALLGRIPSDGLLPRAWHEVALYGPPMPELERKLASLTEDLAWRILRPHVVERS